MGKKGRGTIGRGKEGRHPRRTFLPTFLLNLTPLTAPGSPRMEGREPSAFSLFLLSTTYLLFFYYCVFFFGITSVRFCGGESPLGIGDWLTNKKFGLVVAAVFA